MKPRILSLAAAAALVAVTQAQAQQAANPQAAAQPNPVQQAFVAAQRAPTGPLVPGLCTLSREAVIAGSTVGQYASRRMEEISQATNNEVNTARTTAENEIRTLQGQRATLGDQAFAVQASQVQGRYEQLANIRVAELRETEARVAERILAEATPLIVDSYKAKNCSVILDGSAVFMRADAMDVTSDVITRLNGKLTQFPIERVQAQVQAPPAGAAGAPPVAQTPAPARPAQGPTR